MQTALLFEIRDLLEASRNDTALLSLLCDIKLALAEQRRLIEFLLRPLDRAGDVVVAGSAGTR